MALTQAAKGALAALSREPCNVHLFHSANSSSLSVEPELSISYQEREIICETEKFF